MIQNAIIAAGIAVALLPLLDFLLSSDQKRRLSDKVISFWNWLDEVNRLSYVDWLRSRRAQLIFSLLASLIVIVVYWSEIAAVADKPPRTGDTVTIQNYAVNVAALISIIATAVFGGPRLISYVLQAATPARLLGRACLALLLAVLFGLGSMILNLLFLYRVVRFPKEQVWFDLVFSIVDWWEKSFENIAFVLLIFWAVLAGPLVLIFLVASCLYVLELVIRRIAEYPKGPVLALGILCAAIATLYKILS